MIFRYVGYLFFDCVDFLGLVILTVDLNLDVYYDFVTWNGAHFG